MKRQKVVSLVCLLLLMMTSALGQQSSQNSNNESSVPTMVKFSGTVQGAHSRVVGITFALYKDEQVGAALWMETQSVTLDTSGRYTVQLGSTKAAGLPKDVFESGEARWLGVKPEGQPEQARVLLLSVPYALKAADAQTLGGLPASAFLLANASSAHAAETAAGASNSSSNAAVPPPNAAVTGLGTVNFLPLWDTTSDILSSVVIQTGTGATARIGINTTTPASTLDVKGPSTLRGNVMLPATGAATATAGKNSQPQTLTASVFNSSTNTAVGQSFRWQAEPSGNNTATASGTLNLLFGQGSAAPAETGLKIARNGQITFAAGQTFPGTGTGNGSVTSVASGTGLTGGPITSSGTLSIDSTVVPSKTANNAFSGVQTFNNNNIFNGNQAFNGFNTFTGDQTVNGNITSNQIISAQTLSAANGGITTNFNVGGVASSAEVLTSMVGIGITPAFSLHVNGVIRGETALSLGGSGLIQVDAPGISGGRFTILGNGNVGINNPSPASTLDVAGNINGTGTLTVAGKVSGANGVSLPIAYGLINANATVGKATPNVSVSWDATNKWYVITIAGVNYNFALFVTQATAVMSSLQPQVTANVGSVSGNLLVQLHDNAGNIIQAPFQFTTFGF